jgi:ribonuclease T1
MARMGLREKVAWPVRNVVAGSTRLSHCFDSIRRVAAVAALAALATVASAGFEQTWARSTPSAEFDSAASGIGTVATAQLPPEAVNTLGLIAAGGPYPYEKDGVVFGNYERMLPPHRRGYYHEYTVPTPHAHNRGARRIVCGGPLRRTDNCYYSDDHYASFKRIVE